jgi:tRNA (cmo5U34)-methyltransferase
MEIDDEQLVEDLETRNTPLASKSTVEEIRSRFDSDVERFSSLKTGQAATIDAPLAMSLIAEAAVACTGQIGRVLDIGCGAGNNTLRLRQATGHDFDVDLVDLSAPMLQRAAERVGEVNSGTIRTVQADFRTADLPESSYNVMVAAAVLHHLRNDEDWLAAFRKIYQLLAPGGSVWITDLVFHEHASIQAMMWQRYGDYLTTIGDAAYRDKVFAYIDREDSPRPVTYQLELLRAVGFDWVDLLHKNSSFAAFGAVKRG